MGLSRFAIYLDHPVYYSGQTISGRLIVEVDKPMKMRGVDFIKPYPIHLKFAGQGTVYWTETERRHKTEPGTGRRTIETRTLIYTNSEHYLGLQQLVYGNDSEDCVLAQGEHIFVFNCPLPMNLPSSFEGYFGRIRYLVKVTINRPWKSNHVTKQPMTVVSVYDLNRNPFAVSPVAEHTSKTFWGSSKQLNMSVNIPVRGFVPGQIIPIKVLVNNESKVQVNSIYVTLKQNVMFHAAGKSRATRRYIFRNEFPVKNKKGREEISVNFQLPAVAPSYLEFSRLIDLNYQLNVKAKVKAWYHKDLIIRNEIIVGNIPLTNYQRPIPAVGQMLNESISQEGSSCGQPPAYGLVIPPGTMYQDLPPPTYEQSMGLIKSETENPENHPDSDGEITEFSPLYPVYKFETVQG